MTGDLDGILDRNPSAWAPFVHAIHVHELACHHEAVLDPIPAAQIAGRLEQRLSTMHDQWGPVMQQKTVAITTAWG